MTAPVMAKPSLKICVSDPFGFKVEEREVIDGAGAMKTERYIMAAAVHDNRIIMEVEIGPFGEERWQQVKDTVIDPEGAQLRAAARSKIVQPGNNAKGMH